jgi:hypothetical protein
MGRYRYSDFIRPATHADYDRAIDDRIAWLRRQPGLVSVYAIGSVGHPGISDIDLVALFEDDASVREHPLEGLDGVARYLFVHTLYGAGRTDFLEAQRFSFYQNYRLLFGEAVLPPVAGPEPAARAVIERQIAFEFMLRMYISLFLQREYRLLRLRTLLLHGKGLIQDAATLGVTGQAWRPLLDELMQLRAVWFERDEATNHRALEDWFCRFDPSFTSFLEAFLPAQHPEVPAPSGFPYARNIRVVPATALKGRRSGFRVPFGNAILGRKYFNLLNRFNRITIEAPYATTVTDPLVAEYYRFSAGLRARTREHLPGFFALTSAFQTGAGNP